MIPLPALLAPVQPDAPCGSDPSLTTTLSELESLVRREVGMLAEQDVADEPDWKVVESQALATAKTCKDLRVAGILIAALLRTQGLGGLQTGLQLLRGYLENYWDSVFPLLDAAENNDPWERINAVTNLAAPFGSDGDILRVVAGLRKVTVIAAPQIGRLTLEHYLSAKGLWTWPADQGAAPTTALIEAGVKEVGSAEIVKTIALVDGSLAEINALISIFKTRAGPNLYPVLEPLERELNTILTWLGGTARTATATIESTIPTDSTKTVSSPVATPAPFSGEISSREDVLRALDSIVRYYKQNEPSSPVPFLINRVRRVVTMNFLQLITELTPESTDKILSLTGRIEETTP